MTSAEELELTHAALRAYAQELRRRKPTFHSVEAGLAVGAIAEEIEARFLTPLTITPPPDHTQEQLAAFERGWNEMLAKIDRTPGFRVVAPEPVAAFGERVE